MTDDDEIKSWKQLKNKDNEENLNEETLNEDSYFSKLKNLFKFKKRSDRYELLIYMKENIKRCKLRCLEGGRKTKRGMGTTTWRMTS